MSGALLLIVGVIGIGILHTMVPDHWAPIALLARQRGWTKRETAWAAFRAGVGHVVTTLLFGLAVWWIGASAAAQFGHLIDIAASIALVAFGLWIAFGAWREMRAEGEHSYSHSHGGGRGHSNPQPHSHAGGMAHDHPWEHDRLYASARGIAVVERHAHLHRHGGGQPHLHWHDHGSPSAHAVTATTADAPPLHGHEHSTTGRTALLLVLGSSPMVEGIPAFFAASRAGLGLVAVMAVLFAASTIGTYVVLSVYSAVGLQRLNLGWLERYGEVASGILIAVIGVAFGVITAL